jgi:dethiobiotin synthetase
MMIVGTDTDVGKTYFACALLRAFAALGLRAAGLKPVASGAQENEQGQLRNADALQLQQAANVLLPYQSINPYCFAPAIAPHIAAAEQGITIDLKHIARCYADAQSLCDVVLLEGAGGWLSPLGYGPGGALIDHADLARALNIPVILIVQLRLGCIHQARASLRAIAEDGVHCIGWAANAHPVPMPKLAENIATLRQCLSAPYLGESLTVAAQNIARQWHVSKEQQQ